MQLGPEVTGIYFTNTLSELEASANRVLRDGSGVAIGDYDRDGKPDIFLCGLNTPNALYRNLGNWRFENVTQAAGLTNQLGYSRGAVFSDINGDGWLDLLVTVTGKGVRVYLNNGHGGFTDATATAGTESLNGSLTMAMADVDGNGTLDLYVVNNRAEDIRDRGKVDLQNVQGKVAIPPAYQDRLLILNHHLEEYGEASQLYLNDGGGHFRAMGWTNGMFLDEDGKALSGPPRDWGLTATFRDMNNDGLPDLYVCNDYWTPDRIWINDGKGHLRAIPRLAIPHISASSMGVDFADLDRDGIPDFLVVDMLSRDMATRKRQMWAQTPMENPLGIFNNRPQVMRNTLFHGRADGSYEDIADYAGLSASEWSWQPLFLDVDLDGYEDVVITTGFPIDVQDLDASAQIQARQSNRPKAGSDAEMQAAFTREKMLNARLYPKLDAPIVTFRNRGNLTFEEKTVDWGTGALGVHDGIAMADLDGDGDLDLVVNNLGTGAGLFRNTGGSPRVAVRLIGRAPNTQAIGAKVKLLGGAVASQSQEVVSGGRFLSGSDPTLVFAAGASTNGMSLEITWRSGKTASVSGVVANRIYEIAESNELPPAASQPSPAKTMPLYRDASELIPHRHLENDFDDYARQALLPRRFSRPGPGVAWYDFDHDGHEDLLFSNGKGAPPQVFHNDGHGGFQRTGDLTMPESFSRDQTAILGFRTGPHEGQLFLGFANYEDGETNGAAVLQLEPHTRGLSGVIPAMPSSTGPLAIGDLDGMGRIELFVGGRIISQNYPVPASSRLYRLSGASLVLDEAGTQALRNVGMVTGAVWTDLDGDGIPELVMACEWGPIRILKLQGPTWSDVTEKWGLAAYTGWWNGVTTGDFDGDGKMDLVASNWGLNSPYQASPDQPSELYYGDPLDRGTEDLIEAQWDSRTRSPVPIRMQSVFLPELPFLAGRFTSQKQYSEASVEMLLGVERNRFKKTSATHLATTVFMNRGGRFEAVPLPREAQMAPASAVVVADADGDGHEDIFLSQNCFTVRPDIARLDSGRGLWLGGNGKGEFSAWPSQESGVEVYGDQRSAAVADFNEDGRIDLVITRNAARTRLLQNVGAKPGLRVRLAGHPPNADGIGALLRLKLGAQFGPARELHAGSGYLSQDGAVTVLAMPQPATQLWVRWPGGHETLTDLDGMLTEVTLDATGTIVGKRSRE
jgi:hypothetical protein